MNNGLNHDLCSVSSGLLWHPSDLMSAFDPSHTKVLRNPERQKASDRLQCTQFATLIPQMTIFISKQIHRIEESKLPQQEEKKKIHRRFLAGAVTVTPCLII